MSTYEIILLEKKTTSTGKEKYDATLKDVDSGAEKNATIWSDYPNFHTLTIGKTVYGDLVAAKDPKYAPTLYPPRPEASTGTVRRAGANMERLMDKKQQGVDKSMDRKDESIKISSTMRDSVLITTAQGINGLSDDEVRLRIEAWREWLWFAWDAHGDFPPFPNK